MTFLRDLAVLSGGHLVGKAAGFAVFAVLARTLSHDGYGAVEYLVGLSVLFTTLVEGGLGRVGVRRIAHRPVALAALTAQITLARLALAAISVPLMVLVAMPAVHGGATHGLVWLFALSLLAAPWRQDWLFQATGHMREVALAQGLRTVVFAAVVLAFVRGPANLLVVGWAEIAAAVAMSLYCGRVQHIAITPLRLWAPAGGFAELAQESALVGLAALLGAAIQYAPLFFVASLAAGQETAWFAAANRVVASLLTFTYLYYFGLYPAIAWATTRDREELAKLLAASFRVMAWAGMLVALALTLLAEPLCTLVFGPSFGPSGPMLRIMAWTVPVVLLSGHARWSLVAAGAQSEAAYSQVVGAIAITAFGIPLVLYRGGSGAALASVAASIVVWLTSQGFAARRGALLPPFATALVPGALAFLVIAATLALGLEQWAAGAGALVFGAAAPLLDRRLWPDLVHLAASRWHASELSEPVT